MAIASVLVRDGQRRLELGYHGWQLVEHTTVNLERVAFDLHRGGWAVRHLPGLQHIEVDPDVLSGRPAIRNRRVPVSLVVELAVAPDGDEILREDYDLGPEQTRDAVRWWKTASGYEEVQLAA
ncbi:MAG: DUF433 domain-containing protein [Solirubrobacteraceae bacterium]